MKKISIVIVGNCQARPLAMAISEMVPEIEISGIAIVHLVNDESSSKFNNLFINADYIFAQRVTDAYRCNFVRTNKIISEHGGRVRVWPNLYYAGYTPERF